MKIPGQIYILNSLYTNIHILTYLLNPYLYTYIPIYLYTYIPIYLYTYETHLFYVI
jgi:hypothetical protein